MPSPCLFASTSPSDPGKEVNAKTLKHNTLSLSNTFAAQNGSADSVEFSSPRFSHPSFLVDTIDKAAAQ